MTSSFRRANGTVVGRGLGRGRGLRSVFCSSLLLGRVLDAVSALQCGPVWVSRCMHVPLFLSPSYSPPVRPTPIARLPSAYFPHSRRSREGGRGHGACVDVSGGGRIRTINHQREFARWISLSLVAPPPPPPLASRLVEEGKRGSCLLPWQLYHATETQGSTERERRSLARSLARSPSSFFFFFFFPLFPRSLARSVILRPRRRREA